MRSGGNDRNSGYEFQRPIVPGLGIITTVSFKSFSIIWFVPCLKIFMPKDVVKQNILPMGRISRRTSQQTDYDGPEIAA